MIIYKSLETILDVVVWAWFKEIRVLGQENVPFRRPVVLASTHCNMVVDPVLLALTIPYRRLVHFWAKNSMFVNPVAAHILKSLGAISVDRKNKDNASLFANTFDCLDQGEVMAIFPEGTSYTLPHIMELKDGVSWTVLGHYERILQRAKEYSDAAKDPPSPAALIPVGITYVKKQEWRSVVIVHYGLPIDLEPFIKEFKGDAKKETVRSLTKEVARAMKSITVNAPDWDVHGMAGMAMTLLTPDAEVEPVDYVPMMQNLIDLLGETEGRTDVQQLAADLQRYLNLVRDGTSFSDADIAAFMQRDVGVMGVSLRLAGRAAKLLVELPLYLPGVLFHLPIYAIAGFVERKERYDECKAQNKIGVSVILFPLQYSLLFWLGWSFLGRSLLTFFLAITLTATFAIYHVTLVDERFEMLKGLATAWRMWQAVCLGGHAADVDRKRVSMAVDLRRDVAGQLTRLIRRYRQESPAAQWLDDWRTKHKYDTPTS